MLKSFKKKRTNGSVIIQQKKVVERKRQAKAKAIKEELSDSSDSSDGNSDSEYEEILISNLKKYPLPKHKAETIKPKEKQEEPSVARELKVDLPPKPTQLEKEDTANHSNHFQEEPPPTKPIDIVKKKKHKSKKIVIKKYYQQREPKPQPKKEEPKPKTNFLGFPISDVSENSKERNHMVGRIFNW